MNKLPKEKSGLPSYVEKTSGAQSLSDQAFKAVENIFPNMSPSDLNVFYNLKGRLIIKMSGPGKGKYFLFTKNTVTGEQQINPKLSNEIKIALGKSKYEIEEEERQKKLAADREKYKKVMEEKREEINKKRSERDALEEKYGQTEEVKKLSQEIIVLETEHKEANERYIKSGESEKSLQEEKENLDQEEENPYQEEENPDQVEENPDETERPMTRWGRFKEWIKEFFKKNGVTLATISIAASVTIGTVIKVITDALKSMGKALGNGLKAIAKKTASLLPGLIGSIVSFRFKTAGQAIGFLAEHTWLLILAVVAFLVESYVKKQR